MANRNGGASASGDSRDGGRVLGHHVPGAAVVGRAASRAEQELEDVVGGPARLRVIVLLACILGLNTADNATVGAVATELEKSLHIGNAELGLLVTVSTGVGALASLPVGVLTDRINRVKLLYVGITIWSGATLISGFSTSYTMLLITRLVLGAFVATAGPAVASLTGDFFPASERGRIYGYILAGELIGTAFGYLIPGTVAGPLSWRWAFWILAVPGFVLAVALGKLLPEPARGGQSRLLPGAQEVVAADEVQGAPAPGDRDQDAVEDDEEGDVVRQVEERNVKPNPDLVLTESPRHMSAWQAFRYVLRIRTNVLLIIASSLGYFFLNGLETFAVPFLRGRFGLGQSVANILLVVLGAGALIGVIVAGRAADGLIERRHTAGRVFIGGLCFILAAAIFLPGILVPMLYIAAPLFFLAAAALGGTNPPLDAARLDIMHSDLWGRAESIRTALRSAFTAIAPVTFGVVSQQFGGQGGFGVGNKGASATGLVPTFAIMLIPLALAGVTMFFGNTSYLQDVETAAESQRQTASEDSAQPATGRPG